MADPIVQIYCDGSVCPNPGIGGWGFAAYDDYGTEIHAESGALPHATNNTAEMAAMLHALQWAGQWPAKIHSDSQYVVNGVNQWMYGWAKKGWQRREKGAGLIEIPNAGVWKLLLEFRRPFHEVVWVRGHVGTRGNERADQLAGAARIAFTRSQKGGTHEQRT